MMGHLIILLFSIFTGNLFAQTNHGFGPWLHNYNWALGNHFHQHADHSLTQKKLNDVGEKPCISYEPCEGPGYATGVGYGYGYAPVYDLGNYSYPGFGQSFYQPQYNYFLNDSGRGFNNKYNAPTGNSNMIMLPNVQGQ